MIHPLLKKLATEPSLFVEHVSSYAELATVEAHAVATTWRRRVILWGLAVVLAAVALVLSGMAALLAAAQPLAVMPLPWLLLVLPLVFWAGAALCAWLGWRASSEGAFEHLREQWATDVAWMRSAGESS